MTRLFTLAFFAVICTLGLAGCTTTPPASPAPIATKSTMELLLEVRAKELELERTEQMAWLKFASESKSDMVKGFVMGRSASKGQGPAQSGATQTIAQAQAQADETALRREEMAIRNGWFNKGLQLFDRGAQVFMFSKGLGFRRFEILQANSQDRYRLDTIRGSQRDAYDFAGSAYGAGRDAALDGVNAGRQTAPTGETTTTTEAE